MIRGNRQKKMVQQLSFLFYRLQLSVNGSKKKPFVGNNEIFEIYLVERVTRIAYFINWRECLEMNQATER